MKTLTANLSGRLLDFYEFCRQKKDEEKRLLDARLATPESQRDALLQVSERFIEVFKHYPKYGVELSAWIDFIEVVNEVRVRK